MRHRGVCASLTCRQRTTSLPDARLWQCYMQWTALKATRVCRLRRPATRWPSPWNPPSQSAPSDAVPCPAFDGTDDERAQLHALLNQYAHGFIQDDLGLGYTEAVQHRIPTSDDAAVAQPYRSIPPNQLQEVIEHIKGFLAQSHCGEPQSLRSSGGPGEEEGRQSSALCWRQATELEVCWWCLPTPQDPGVPGCTHGGPVLLDLGPRQWVPPGLHGSPGPAQDSVHDTFRLVWIHKDADEPGVSPCHLPASDAGNHVRLCLPVSACVPRRPPCLFQDVRRTHGAPGTTPAARDRDRSETESQQVPVPETWSHLSWPHDLGWWSELRVWQVECVQKWPTPTTTELRSFLGFASYYRLNHQRVCQDCRAAPWPGERRSQALQEEGSWRIQALGSQAPRGLRLLEGGYDNSSCTWLRWLHQALHLGDGCQPWRAQRHPVPGTGWEVKSICLCQPMPPTQWEKQFTLQQHEARVSCHEMGNNGQLPALPVGRKVHGHHRQQSADLLSLREIRRVGAKMGLSSHSSILTSSTDLERSTLLIPFPACPSNPLLNPSWLWCHQR